MEQTFQSLATEYRDLLKKSGAQCGEGLRKTLTRLKEIEQQLREMTAAISRCTGGPTNYRSGLRMIKWIDVTKQTPAQWGAENHWGKGEGRHRVKLADGREIFTWWKDGKWSVERLMPHLKVAYWERPVLIA